MTDETNGAGQTDAEDTSAVLAIASGEKTYLAPKDEVDAAPGDDAAAATEQDEGQSDKPAPKPKQTAQERIDELTRARREAERDRDFYKEQALRGGAPAEKPTAQAAQPHDDGRPDPANYEGGIYDPAYVDAQIDWRADQAVQRRLSEREAREAVTTRLSTFQSRAAELFPDGEPDGLKAFRAAPSVPEPIAEVILASDIGPKIAEHLGDNLRELQRISGLSPALQARELTLLETRLADPPKPTPKTATDAPEPAPQARGAGGQFKVAADTNDFAAFEKQHMPGG